MPTKPQLLILSALPAAGKTTTALAWLAEDPANRLRINWDELRLELFGPSWRFNHNDEQKMKAESWNRAKATLESGKSVIIDNTNLTKSVRNYWRNLGLHCGAEVIEEELDVPVKECVKRDRLREGSKRVGRAVIERMALTTGWIDWNDTNTYMKAKSGKDFVIFDIDGTLADCSHRLHHVRPTCPKCGSQSDVTKVTAAEKKECPDWKDWGFACYKCDVQVPKKNWSAFFREVDKDPLIQPIAKLLSILSNHYYILVVSGRPIDPCGKPTEDWLLRYGIDPLHLFMRAGNDSRSDVLAKQEILDLLPKDRIAYVFDDRSSVVEGVWRKAGLTCLQCDKGDF